MRVRGARASLAAVLVAAVGVTAPPAAAGGPGPPGRPAAAARVTVHAALVAVSCPAAADCFAAGSYVPGGRGQGFRPLIERFNGTAWSVMPVPAPKALYTQLYGVSCASATGCVAVGIRTTRAHGTQPFAEVWDGSRWSISPTVVPPRTTRSELNAVSCAVSGTCVAVGFDNPSGREIAANLAERWDGTRWTVVLSAPHPELPTNLIGVSCVTATDCTAGGWIGARSPAGVSFPLLKRWNGTGWQTMPSPHPAKLNESTLIGVSCPPGAGPGCMGVGDYFTRSPDFYQYNLAERWNGRQWSVLPAPDAGSTQVQLSGVYCNAPDACMAVGNLVNSERDQLPLAERWNGHRLSVLVTPNPPLGGGGFDGVSCPSTTLCVATGAQGSSEGILTFTEVWRAGTWRIVPSPSP